MSKKMDVIREEIQNLEIEGEDSENIRKALEQLATGIVDHKLLPKEAMGISNEMMEGIYSYAYRLYNVGRYERAVQLFRLLILLDPSCAKYMLGLGACFHMKKDYEIAATCYLLCTMIDPKNPIPFYHASDCYMKLDKPEHAIAALKACLRKIEGKEELSTIRDRVQVTLDSYEEQFAKKNAEQNQKEKAA